MAKKRRGDGGGNSGVSYGLARLLSCARAGVLLAQQFARGFWKTIIVMLKTTMVVTYKNSASYCTYVNGKCATAH